MESKNTEKVELPKWLKVLNTVILFPIVLTPAVFINTTILIVGGWFDIGGLIFLYLNTYSLVLIGVNRFSKYLYQRYRSVPKALVPHAVALLYYGIPLSVFYFYCL